MTHLQEIARENARRAVEACMSVTDAPVTSGNSVTPVTDQVLQRLVTEFAKLSERVAVLERAGAPMPRPVDPAKPVKSGSRAAYMAAYRERRASARNATVSASVLPSPVTTAEA